METTKQEIRNYFFGNIFPFEDEVEFTIRGEKADLFEAIELCVDHITTSQKKTIERLREGIEWELSLLKDERAKNGWRLSESKQHSRLLKLLAVAEQLLNTTEPIDQ